MNTLAIVLLAMQAISAETDPTLDEKASQEETPISSFVLHDGESIPFDQEMDFQDTEVDTSKGATTVTKRAKVGNLNVSASATRPDPFTQWKQEREEQNEKHGGGRDRRKDRDEDEDRDHRDRDDDRKHRDKDDERKRKHRDGDKEDVSAKVSVSWSTKD